MNYRMSTKRWFMLHAVTAITLACWIPAQAQESRWAKADDSTAKSLIKYERLWAESDCTHNSIEKTILAEDFQGTAPSGSRYSKKEATDEFSGRTTEEACELYEVTVHFFGDAMAILYAVKAQYT